MPAKKNSSLALEKQAQNILRLLSIPRAVCRVNLVSNREMNRIKKTLIALPQFRGAEAEKIKRERCVNVLAFPEPESFPHPETKKRMLGEVYINKGYARGSRGVMAYLLTHGMLHLLGYCHSRKRDRIEMEALEEKLWHRVLS